MAATNTKRMVQKAWLGGMNTYAADDSLENNQAFRLENISLMHRTQSVAKISGSRKYLAVQRSQGLAPSTVIHNLFHFTKKDNTSSQLVCFSDSGGSFIAYFNESGFTILDPENPLDYITQPVKDWCTFAGKVYFVTGENAVFSWDSFSSTYTKEAFPFGFHPTIIEMYNSRAYYAGDEQNPSRVVFSLPNEPGSFNTPLADFLDVSDSLGDGIVDLKPLGSSLVAFKKRSVHLIIGSPPREVREVSGIGIGAISGDTIQRTQLGLVFLSELGVYAFNGESLQKLSLAVEPNIQRAIKTSHGKFSSVYYNNTYYVFNQGAQGTTINQGAAFALDTLEFGGLGVTMLNDFHCRHNIVLSAFDANNDWLCAKDGTNVIMKMNNEDYPYYYESDDKPAESLTSLVVTHWEDMQNPTIMKSLRTIHFLTHTPLVNLKVKVEYSSYTQDRAYDFNIKGDANLLWAGGGQQKPLWNNFEWEPSNDYHHRIIMPPGIDFSRVRLHITSDDPEELFDLMAIEYHFVPRREI